MRARRSPARSRASAPTATTEQRLIDLIDQAGRATATRPPTGRALAFHVIRLCLFGAVPLALSQSTTISEHDALCRLVAWSVLCELSGFGTLDGPLGHGHSIWTQLRLRLSPGTLKQASAPGLGQTRTILDVALFVLTFASLTFVLLASSSLTYLRLAASLWTALIALDRSAYVGAMGAYYYPLLVCCCWPEAQAVAALQLVQMAHLFVPGVAKAGPWFEHVSPTMLAAAPLPMPMVVRTALFEDAARGDLRPRRRFVALAVAASGVAAEVTLPIVWCFEATREIGVALAVGMHGYIIAMGPLGAVAEWNLVNILVTRYLFDHHRTFLAPTLLASDAPWTSWLLFAFVALSCFALPLLALLVMPKTFSNHFALRKYTGNHPYHTFVCRRSVLERLNAVPSVARLDARTAAGLDDPNVLSTLATLARGRLNAKALPRLLAAALEFTSMGSPVGHDLSEWCLVPASHFLGNTMLDVTFVDDKLLRLLQERCGLPRRHMFSIRIESFPLLWSNRRGLALAYEQDFGFDEVRGGMGPMRGKYTPGLAPVVKALWHPWVQFENSGVAANCRAVRWGLL